MLLDQKSAVVEKSMSVVGFFRDGTAKWELKNRYLTIAGVKAYHFGFACETCSYLFERLDGADKYASILNVVENLNLGIERLTGEIESELTRIVPNGEYFISLQRITPILVEQGQEADYFSNEQAALWHDTNSPGVNYYKLRAQALPDEVDFFEFLVPMYSQEVLDPERLIHYKERIICGSKPTALALSTIEIKKHPDGHRTHLILTHYLLDGHHKTFSAATGGSELTLLSYISLNEGDAYRISFERLFSQLIEA